MLEKVIAIAVRAGEIILDIRQKGFESKTKRDEFDFVTDADIAAEKYILEQLEREFPQDSILSEEKGLIDKNSTRVWHIDPLDGTKDFKHGGSEFSVVIGLCENNKPVLGVVYDPSRRKIYFAQKGKGAFMRVSGTESKLAVSSQKAFDSSTMIVRIPHGEPREADKFEHAFNVKKKIKVGSIGLKMALVASGEADFFINTNSRTSKWDTCGAQIILEESGGKITDFASKSLDYSQKETGWQQLYIVSNGKLHKEALAMIQRTSSNK